MRFLPSACPGNPLARRVAPIARETNFLQRVRVCCAEVWYPVCMRFVGGHIVYGQQIQLMLAFYALVISSYYYYSYRYR